MNWPELPRQMLIMLVSGYRLLLSPWLGSQCRFEPTCSLYALGALQAHGAAGGSYLAARRLLRCHPWCAGGHDPVPVDRPRLFVRRAQAPAPGTTPPSSSKTSS
jgi:uncharacterized protein